MKFQYRHNNDMFRRRVGELCHHATLKSVVKEIIKPV